MSSDRKPLRGPDSIRRNTAFALVSQLTTATFTALLTLYLVRALGPHNFGVLALALSVAGLFRLVGSFGIQSSVARFLAEVRDDADACARLLRDAFRLTLATSTAMCALLFIGAGLIGDAYGNEELVWPLRWLALAVVAECLFTLYLATFAALARIRVNVRLIFFESVAETAATASLVFLVGGAAAASLGRTIGYGVGMLVAIGLVIRMYGRSAVFGGRRHGATTGSDKGRIIRYAIPTFAIDALYGLYARIDILVVGALLDTVAVGLLAAPLRVTAPLGHLGLAAASSVSPRQAATTPEGRNVHAFLTAIRWLLVFQAVVAVTILLWAEPLVDLLLGDDYAESATVLRLLTPYIFLMGVSPLISSTATFVGLAGRRIPIVFTALALNLAIDVTLLPRIGIEAAAIGTSVAYLVYVPAHLLLCRSVLGFSLRPVALTLTRVLAASGAMAAVVYVLGGTAALTGADAAAGLLGLAAYALTLVLTREVTRVELGRGWRSARRTAATVRRSRG